MTRSNESSSSLSLFASPVFVLLWSTGFIGAKYGLPYAEPLTFLSVRFILAGGFLALWVWLSRSEWLNPKQTGHQLLVGALLHGGYLGGVFTAISLGVEAGASALIVSMQPILTAVLARWMLDERMVPLQWLGLAFGFIGVALVVEQKIEAGLGDMRGVALCVLALVSISVATLYQKKYCTGTPMRAGAVVQYIGAMLIIYPLSLLFETGAIEWTGEFIFALFWLVFMLSIGALSLLMALIRRGEASRVASLFFLVPPCTAVMAWIFFGETLGPLSIAGVVLATLGVALVMRAGKKS